MNINYLTNPDFKDLEFLIKNIPENFDSTGIVIKNDRNEIRITELNGIKVVAKSFKKVTVANRIIYRFFRKSKAQRAYEYGLILKEKGINTPLPVGYIDQFSRFKLKKSYFISLFVDNNSVFTAIKEAATEAERETILKELAQFIFQTHSKGVFHRDLNMGNILYEKKENSGQFHLIDNNRMSFRKPSLSARVNNLKYINLPIEQYAVLMVEYTRFLENPHYVLRRILHAQERQIKVKKILNIIKKPFKIF